MDKKGFIFLICWLLLLCSLIDVDAVTMLQIRSLNGTQVQSPRVNDTSIILASSGVADNKDRGLATYLEVGKYNSGYNTRKALLWFNLNEIPQGANIIYANLTLRKYVYGVSSTSVNSCFDAKRVTSYWSQGVCELTSGCTPSSLNHGATYSERYYGMDWGVSGGDYVQENLASSVFCVSSSNYSSSTTKMADWDLTEMVIGWYNGSYNNYGVVIEEMNVTAQNNKVNYLKFYSSESSTVSYRPTLTILYNISNASQSGYPAPVVNLSRPYDSFYGNNRPQSFIVGVTGDHDNVTLYGNFSGTFVKNETKSGSYTYNFTQYLSDGAYLWNAYACNNNNCTFYSTNFTITIYTQAPNLTIVSPDDGTTQQEIFNLNATFEVSSLIGEISYCSLFVDGISRAYDTSITKDVNQSIIWNGLTLGNHLWYIGCFDSFGNYISSVSRSLTVTAIPPVELNRTFFFAIQNSSGSNVSLFSNYGDIITNGNVTASNFRGYVSCDNVVGLSTLVCNLSNENTFQSNYEMDALKIDDLISGEIESWQEVTEFEDFPSDYLDGIDNYCDGQSCDLYSGYNLSWGNFALQSIPDACPEGYVVQGLVKTSPPTWTCVIPQNLFEDTYYKYNFSEQLNIIGLSKELGGAEQNVTGNSALDYSDGNDLSLDGTGNDMYFEMKVNIQENYLTAEEMVYEIEAGCNGNLHPYLMQVWNVSNSSWYDCYDYYADSRDLDNLIKCEFENTDTFDDFINATGNQTIVRLYNYEESYVWGMGGCNIDFADFYLLDSEPTSVTEMTWENIALENQTNYFNGTQYFNASMNVSGDVKARGFNGTISCENIAGNGSDGNFCLDSSNAGMDYTNIAMKNQSNTFTGNISAPYFMGKINYSDIQNSPVSTTYYPFNITTIYGTHDSGNISDIYFYDSKTYNISEAAGSNPLTVEINFTGVTCFDSILMREQYSGGLGHEIEVQLWETSSSSWHSYYEITDQSSLNVVYLPIPDTAEHIDGGYVSMRLTHTGTGVVNHDLFIDFVQLIDGTTTLTNAEHDSLSGRDIISNHPQYLDKYGVRNQTLLRITEGLIAYNGTFIGRVTADSFNGSLNCADIEGATSNLCTLTDTASGMNYTNVAMINKSNTFEETQSFSKSIVVTSDTNLSGFVNLFGFNSCSALATDADGAIQCGSDDLMDYTNVSMLNKTNRFMGDIFIGEDSSGPFDLVVEHGSGCFGGAGCIGGKPGEVDIEESLRVTGGVCIMDDVGECYPGSSMSGDGGLFVLNNVSFDSSLNVSDSFYFDSFSRIATLKSNVSIIGGGLSVGNNITAKYFMGKINCSDIQWNGSGDNNFCLDTAISATSMDYTNIAMLNITNTFTQNNTFGTNPILHIDPIKQQIGIGTLLNRTGQFRLDNSSTVVIGGYMTGAKNLFSSMLYIDANFTGSTPRQGLGIWSRVVQSGTGDSYSIYGEAFGEYSSTATNVSGVYGFASGSGTDVCYGVYGQVSGCADNRSYAVYSNGNLMMAGTIKADGSKTRDIGQPSVPFDDVWADDFQNMGLPFFGEEASLEMLRNMILQAKPTKSYDQKKKDLNISELDPATLPLELTGYYSLKKDREDCLKEVNESSGGDKDKKKNTKRIEDCPEDPDSLTPQEWGISTTNSVALLLENVKYLYNENEILKRELCLRDNSYSWCVE